MLGRRITRWRKYRRLTQSEIARRVGVSPTAVHGWISGRIYPSYPRLERLAGILGVTLGQFFGPIPK